jgi:small subunit ribosomal protein S7
MDGKKGVAEKIVYGAFDRPISARPGVDPDALFHEALDNVRRASRCARAASAARPIRCRSRFGPSAPGAGDPLADRDRAATAPRTRWSDRLSGELLDATNNRGAAVKKREDTHRMAEANKAFSHYRW